MESRVAWLFRSPAVAIVDWRCAGHAGPLAAEEWNDVRKLRPPDLGALRARAPIR